MNDRTLTFEQGPIRPPNEARSLLLRFTRNCPWNRCEFCPVYKGRKFSLRSVADIKQDIQTARDIYDDVLQLSWRLGSDGRVDDRVISDIFNRNGLSSSYKSVASWIYYGTQACFLQDADNLIMPVDDLVEALTFLKDKIPMISRITTYTRSKTITRRSVESLKRIRAAGLDRIHIGLESGYDPLLKLIKKGVTGEGHIEAGRRVKAAGMALSEYVMPGLGGREMSKGHAEATAAVLNAIDPDFIRLRSLRVPRRVPLYQRLEAGTFTMLSDDELADELHLLISSLNGITSTLTSDHIMNLLEDLKGKFPEDKPRMLAAIEAYQGLDDVDRLVFRVGRRGGAYQSTKDLQRDPQTYRKIKNLVEQVRAEKGDAGVEEFITEMSNRYI